LGLSILQNLIIQKDRVLQMKQWADEINSVEVRKERGRRNEVNLAMIAANSHYAGFGPVAWF
jgi:hypothetical protein